MKLFLIAAFSLNFILCMFVAMRMPVFNHIDELAHFDYALKLARGVKLTSQMSMEPDADKLWISNIDAMNHHYMSPTTPLAKTLQNESHELMQPKLMYMASAVVVWVCNSLEFTLAQQLLMLRIFCVIMVLAAKVMIFKAIDEVWRPAALLATAHLAGMVPVDLLRFSNDTFAAIIGAAMAWLLVLSVKRPHWRYTVAIMILLCISAFTKLTALLFLGAVIAAVKLVFISKASIRRDIIRLLVIFVPAGLCAVTIGYANLRFSGRISGLPAGSGVTQPEGWALMQRAFSTSMWQWWHETWLTIETLIKGKRGPEIYPIYFLVTWLIVGQVLALCWLVFTPRKPNPPYDGITSDLPADLRRWVVAAFLSTAAIQIVAVLILALVGQIWVASRMVAPGETWPLMLATCGYSLAIRQLYQSRHRVLANLILWISAYAVWASAARAYLRFRGHT